MKGFPRLSRHENLEDAIVFQLKYSLPFVMLKSSSFLNICMYIFLCVYFITLTGSSAFYLESVCILCIFIFFPHPVIIKSSIYKDHVLKGCVFIYIVVEKAIHLSLIWLTWQSEKQTTVCHRVHQCIMGFTIKCSSRNVHVFVEKEIF